MEKSFSSKIGVLLALLQMLSIDIPICKTIQFRWQR